MSSGLSRSNEDRRSDNLDKRDPSDTMRIRASRNGERGRMRLTENGIVADEGGTRRIIEEEIDHQGEFPDHDHLEGDIASKDGETKRAYVACMYDTGH